MKTWIIHFIFWALCVAVVSAGVWLCELVLNFAGALWPHIEAGLDWCKAHPPALLFVLLAAAATVSTLMPKDRV